ncbi:MAG TPA: preprotein translocase subunit SecE [Steroidobacteraceae bacterium]|nr:preprotein translocase subunit SecE [Steroidobacteraceae bacterium]HRX90268.1 preprotein translocase subunit SecE [Steroidobacteraceae bacterium]
MNEEAKHTGAVPTGGDSAKLILAIALVVGGIVAFYLLSARPEWMRWLAMVAGLGLAALVFFVSQYGRDLWQFALESRIELRKIFWPNRQETGMTTLIVFGFVIVMSLFFWVLDLILASITRMFTGQGG